MWVIVPERRAFSLFRISHHGRLAQGEPALRFRAVRGTATLGCARATIQAGVPVPQGRLARQGEPGAAISCGSNKAVRGQDGGIAGGAVIVWECLRCEQVTTHPTSYVGHLVLLEKAKFHRFWFSPRERVDRSLPESVGSGIDITGSAQRFWRRLPGLRGDLWVENTAGISARPVRPLKANTPGTS